MQTLILGNGPLGWAVATAAGSDSGRTVVVGRPPGRQHDRTVFEGVDLVIDASRGDAVACNVGAALDAGVRRLVIATTGWDGRDELDATLRSSEASAVVASNFSLGVVLFGRLVDAATDLFGALDTFDPYLVEWHRRGKRDRPSGTARDLARRMVERHPDLTGTDDLETVSIRAGSNPGMHLVGFDAPGETVELRITARDRTAYATGILAAAAWLRQTQRSPGISPFDVVVDDLLACRPTAAA